MKKKAMAAMNEVKVWSRGGVKSSVWGTYQLKTEENE